MSRGRVSNQHRNQALLWAVYRDDLIRGYLFGTMHVRDKSAFLFADMISDHIRKCKIYAAEMNLEEVDPKVFIEASRLAPGQTIDSLLGKSKYTKLEHMIRKSFAIDLNLYLHQHPFLISTYIAESILSNDHNRPLDHYLWNIASGEGLQMTGLESFQRQIEIMDKIPIKGQLKALTEIGKNPAKYRKTVLKLVSRYQNADLPRLYKTSKNQLGLLRKMMLYDRNIVFARRLCDLLASDITFGAFGAAHLWGKSGVLRLIKFEGYKVKPIHY